MNRVSDSPNIDLKHRTINSNSVEIDISKNANGVLKPDVDLIDAMNRVFTEKQTGGITGENNPMLSQNLSRIIRWYKGRTTYYARPIHAEFAWQTRFRDHIIHDNESYYKIRKYIEENPARWGMDQMNNEHI